MAKSTNFSLYHQIMPLYDKKHFLFVLTVNMLQLCVYTPELHTTGVTVYLSTFNN